MRRSDLNLCLHCARPPPHTLTPTDIELLCSYPEVSYIHRYITLVKQPPFKRMRFFFRISCTNNM